MSAPSSLLARPRATASSLAALRRPQVLAVLAVVTSLAYVTWRLLATVDLAVWWVAVPLWLVELHSAVTFALFVFTAWDTQATPPAAPVSAAPGRVAVLIPTYNEPVEVLLPTVAAAVAMDLEHETWVLDDGDRDWVRALAGELGARYSARPTHEHAKAGNLNTALEHVDADFVAVLDADHVPSRTFLSATLGHFADPRVALVQTPQDFYNEDSFEHMASRRGRAAFCEQSLFYRVLQPGRNRWNAAFWCGTNAVLRRTALTEVGGLATESITEDIHTTIRLHRAGWRTVYHDEVLARGLAAADGAQYLAQRVRWGTGAMQVLRQERPLFDRRLTWPQRLSYAATLLGWFDAWRTLAYLVLPVAVLLTGASPIAAPAAVFAAALLPTLLLQHVAMSALGRGHSSVVRSLVFEFVRMPANLAATITLFLRRDVPFRVTHKGRAGDTRQRVAAPPLHAALAVLGALALGFYALSALGATPLVYGEPWAAHVSAALLALDLGVLLVAVARIRSPRFSTERRGAVRLPLAADARLDGRPAQVLDVSCTGARVVLPADAPVLPLAVLTLAVDGTAVRLVTELVGEVERGVGRVCTLRFLPHQLPAQALLARWLFARGTAPAVAVPVRSAVVPAQRAPEVVEPVPAA